MLQLTERKAMEESSSLNTSQHLPHELTCLTCSDDFNHNSGPVHKTVSADSIAPRGMLIADPDVWNSHEEKHQS